MYDHDVNKNFNDKKSVKCLDMYDFFGSYKIMIITSDTDHLKLLFYTNISLLVITYSMRLESMNLKFVRRLLITRIDEN